MINTATDTKSNGKNNSIADISTSVDQSFGTDKIEFQTKIVDKKFSRNNKKIFQKRVFSYLAIFILVIGSFE